MNLVTVLFVVDMNNVGVIGVVRFQETAACSMDGRFCFSQTDWDQCLHFAVNILRGNLHSCVRITATHKFRGWGVAQAGFESRLRTVNIVPLNQIEHYCCLTLWCDFSALTLNCYLSLSHRRHILNKYILTDTSVADMTPLATSGRLTI